MISDKASETLCTRFNQQEANENILTSSLGNSLGVHRRSMVNAFRHVAFFANPAHVSDRLCIIQHSSAISFSAGAPINLKKKHGGPTKAASPYSGIALVFLLHSPSISPPPPSLSLSAFLLLYHSSPHCPLDP